MALKPNGGKIEAFHTDRDTGDEHTPPLHEWKHVGLYNRWTSGTGFETIILEDMNGDRWASYGDTGVLVRWPLGDEFPKVWPKDALNPHGLPYPLPAFGPHRG